MPFYRSWLKTQWRYLSMLSFTTVSTMPLSLLPTWRTHITQHVFLLRLPWEIFWVPKALARSSVIERVFPVPCRVSLMKPPPLGVSKWSVWKCEPNSYTINLRSPINKHLVLLIFQQFSTLIAICYVKNEKKSTQIIVFHVINEKFCQTCSFIWGCLFIRDLRVNHQACLLSGTAQLPIFNMKYIFAFLLFSKDARLPVQLQRAMAAEAEAAREARAKVCHLVVRGPVL